MLLARSTVAAACDAVSASCTHLTGLYRKSDIVFSAGMPAREMIFAFVGSSAYRGNEAHYCGHDNPQLIHRGIMSGGGKSVSEDSPLWQGSARQYRPTKAAHRLLGWRISTTRLFSICVRAPKPQGQSEYRGGDGFQVDPRWG